MRIRSLERCASRALVGKRRRTGKDPEELGGWERRVKEEANLGIGESLPEHSWNQHQVVVVNPN